MARRLPAFGNKLRAFLRHDLSAMRLKTLKARLATLDPQRVPQLTASPNATQRLRGRAWMVRREQWLRSHPLCVQCAAGGQVTIAREVDHITPLWMGGADNENNYQSLCISCHLAKTSREAVQRAAR